MFQKTSLLALICALTQSAYGVLALQSYDADKHSRFNNHPSFIGAAQDWSGVARASNGRWVTMISSTYFISATHAAPATGNSVVFHEDNDASGTTISRTISSVTRIGTTDLVIGRLDSAPGPTIAIYGITANTTNQANFSSSPYSDRVAFIVGIDSSGSGTTQFRIGRNVLDGFADDIEVSPSTNDAIIFNDHRNTPQSLGADEAYLQGGDSGAPMFVTSGTDLVLTGVNWFNGFYDEEPSQLLSGASFLPSYLSEIETIVNAGGESLTLVSVPEPSIMTLLALSGIILLHRRR